MNVKFLSCLSFMLVFLMPFAYAQEKTITGTVKDDEDTPLPGVNITVEGTSKGTSTDFDGEYEIEAEEGQVLIFSSVGFEDKAIAVEDETTIDITMEEGSVLDEVVVTALGIEREEKALGYATQSVDAEALTTVKGTSAATSLTGKISGLNVRNSTEFDEEPSMLLRGKTPLIVIDEVPYGNTSLSDIPADDIQEISVLKGPAAR